MNCPPRIFRRLGLRGEDLRFAQPRIKGGDLDSIAAAVIGGVVARHVYSEKVNIGLLASIVAVANAGGTCSVIGDATTTI
jgi:hypothetical protein